MQRIAVEPYLEVAHELGGVRQPSELWSCELTKKSFELTKKLFNLDVSSRHGVKHSSPFTIFSLLTSYCVRTLHGNVIPFIKLKKR